MTPSEAEPRAPGPFASPPVDHGSELGPKPGEPGEASTPPPAPAQGQSGAWGLTLGALVVLLLGLASGAGLHQNDEDLYVGIAQSMARSGDWIVPNYLGDIDFHKPPLLYWMMRVTMACLGPSLLAARLPVALCGAGLVWTTYQLVVEGLACRERVAANDLALDPPEGKDPSALLDPSATAGLAAGLCATSLGFVFYARTGMMDIPLALALAQGLLGWLEVRSGREAGAWRLAVCAGLAFLLKGPVGVVILALCGLAWWLSTRPWLGALPRGKAGASLLGGLALLGFWPCLLVARGLGSEWVQTFVLAENLGKFHDIRNPISGMVTGYAGLLAPWTLLGLAGLVESVRQGRARQPLESLLLCLIGATLLVYSLPAVKWAQYLLPCTAALSILGALALTSTPSKGTRLAATLTGLALGVAAVPLLVLPRLFESPGMQALLLVAAACCLVGGGCLLGARSVEGAVLTTWVAQACLLLAAPQLSPDQLPAELGTVVAHRPLVGYRLPAERYSNLLGYRARTCTDPTEARAALEAGALLVVSNSDLAELDASHVLDTQHLEVLLCWNRWRKHLNGPQIQTALQLGTTRPLLENLNLVRMATP